MHRPMAAWNSAVCGLCGVRKLCRQIESPNWLTDVRLRTMRQHTINTRGCINIKCLKIYQKFFCFKSQYVFFLIPEKWYLYFVYIKLISETTTKIQWWSIKFIQFRLSPHHLLIMYSAYIRMWLNSFKDNLYKRINFLMTHSLYIFRIANNY